MKSQRLTIRVVDARKPEGHPERERTKTFTSHQDYLRAMGRFARPAERATEAGGYDLAERTETVLTITPRARQQRLV